MPVKGYNASPRTWLVTIIQEEGTMLPSPNTPDSKTQQVPLQEQERKILRGAASKLATLSKKLAKIQSVQTTHSRWKDIFL